MNKNCGMFLAQKKCTEIQEHTMDAKNFFPDSRIPKSYLSVKPLSSCID